MQRSYITKSELLERQKKIIWRCMCIGDYPKKLPTKRFLAICLTSAKKTYERNVSFYCWINWLNTDSLARRLEVACSNFERLIKDLRSILEIFKRQLEYSRLKERYLAFISTLQIFKEGVSDDYQKVAYLLSA